MKTVGSHLLNTLEKKTARSKTPKRPGMHARIWLDPSTAASSPMIALEIP
jgi:hypothetical protein